MPTKVALHPEQDKRAGLKREDVGGRYMTVYDPSIALQIVEKVAAGHTLKAVCAASPGMPSPVTFQRWVVNNPDLARAYTAAKEMRAGAFEDEAIELGRELRRDPGTGTKVRAYEVLMAQLRWSAERADPAKYANRGQIQVRVPIQINTTLDMGKDSHASAPDHPNIYTINAGVAVDVDGNMPTAVITDGSRPLVEPKPILGGRAKRKQILIPPNGRPKEYTPFSKIARGSSETGKTEDTAD